jgi:hypothetical protein
MELKLGMYSILHAISNASARNLTLELTKETCQHPRVLFRTITLLMCVAMQDEDVKHVTGGLHSLVDHI